MYKSKELTCLTDKNLENEEKLDISNNFLENLKGIEKSSLTLSWLNASHNKLNTISHLTSCKNLKVLNLSFNKLTNTFHVSELKNLKALILNNNELEKVEGLDELKELNTLVLSHNRLSSINVTNLPNLQKFSASHNCLYEIPDFQKQKDIKDVKLNNNVIENLPQWLPKCKRIKVIDLGNNKFSTIESIKLLGELPFLENLNLKGNPLCSLEDYYTKIKNLLPHLKLLDFKNLNEMYLKQLQNKPAVVVTKNNIDQDVKSKETEERGFISSNLNITQISGKNPVELEKKTKLKKKKKVKKKVVIKKELTEKNTKKSKKIKKETSLANTSENKPDDTQYLSSNILKSQFINKSELSDGTVVGDSRKRKTKSEKEYVNKTKGDNAKVAKKDKSGIVSVKKIKSVNCNKDISFLLKNISNENNLGAGLNSTW
ncbi:ras suppressor protein 1 isoform X1 [Hydra vulgaris]|uniref:ras suppressor protein 1 isoform X1 n=1 Tax=Hydra vulgaris TaxID=6087 RepID=UPI001F5F34C2|nr:ras suppressor protein 1 [Hydra vulgaris]